jgi:hypothetical protein
VSDPAGGQLALAVGITTAVVAALDKLIEQRWPNTRINSIFDVVARVITVLMHEIAGTPQARRPAAKPRRATAVAPAVGPMAVLEVAGVVAEHQERQRLYAGTVPPTSDPGTDAYWERKDIQEWAAAHPKLAADLKRAYGRG